MSNKDLIALGLSASLVLPASAYWKKTRSFKANSALLNYDAVTTNSRGSTINLDVSDETILGGAGARFGANCIQMSSGADSITLTARAGVKLSDTGLLIEGQGESYYSPTPGSINLGNGKNSIIVNGNQSYWDTGIRVGTQARLVGGTGQDLLQSIGSKIGLSVFGSILLGAGDDVIDASSMSGETAINVDDTGLIDMGAGNDTITGRSGSRSIYISGRVLMGDGNDIISGLSLWVNSYKGAFLDMGAGDDTISAPLVSANSARIDFGSGVDKLTVSPGIYTATKLEDGGLTLTGFSSLRIYGLEYLVSSKSGLPTQFTAGNLTII